MAKGHSIARGERGNRRKETVGHFTTRPEEDDVLKRAAEVLNVPLMGFLRDVCLERARQVLEDEEAKSRAALAAAMPPEIQEILSRHQAEIREELDKARRGKKKGG